MKMFVDFVKKYIKEFWDDGKSIGDFGKVVNSFHYERLCNLMKDHQGSVVYGNPAPYHNKRLTPTVVINPSLDSALMKEEIFGPILPILKFTTI